MDSNAGPGFCPAPPPPPPPPPPVVPGQVPALRINAAETAVPGRRRPLSTNSVNDAYEPPAAIQNAMMTKDKKPFTYTPGMGGKLDLSQIRSPRMARRVAKNANDEGIEGPPKSSPTEPRPLSMTTGTSLYTQPQVAVPVFPTNLSPAQQSTTIHDRGPTSNSRVPSHETKMGTITATIQNSPPETPTSPTVTQVTLTKAPTPWLQNKNKPQEELPEWAKRSSVVGTSAPTSPSSVAHRQQQQSPPSSPLQQQSQERIIPLRIEDRPSVFSVKNDSVRQDGSKQQPQSPSSHHQQRWGNGTASPQQQPSSKSGTYIVPIVVEGSSSNNNNNNERHSPRVIIQRAPQSPQTIGQHQAEPGPVQSRSFRVLQKITDTDSPMDQVDGQRLRRLDLAENDKILMNKVKERVDGDGTYLHQEEDPRYRGAAIPSRAFRYLRNMTDAGDASQTTVSGQRTSGAVNKRQTGNSSSFEETPVNLPASEQQVPEPKKYTGSAIPSRSFRILQAMTAPESIGPDQTDY